MVDHKQKGDGTGGDQQLVVMKKGGLNTILHEAGGEGREYEHVVDANNEPTK